MIINQIYIVRYTILIIEFKNNTPVPCNAHRPKVLQVSFQKILS